MVLAGGALVATGCGSEGASNFCCNANGDPCCEVLNCGAPMTPACASEMACEREGGAYVEGVCGNGIDASAPNLTGLDATLPVPLDGGGMDGSAPGDAGTDRDATDATVPGPVDEGGIDGGAPDGSTDADADATD
jgi:hypothetical protein